IDTARHVLAEKTSDANAQLLATVRPLAPRYIEVARELNRRRSVLLTPFMDGKASVAGAVLLEAENYTRGNVKKDFTVYGEKIGVIYNAGPLPNIAEYDVTLAKAGTYQLELRFAAAESRPVDVEINGKVVKSGAAAAVTGTWYPDSQKWSAEGVFALAAGK